MAKNAWGDVIAESGKDWGDKPAAQQELPEGVEPSAAGGGRGRVNPGSRDISLANTRPRATDAEIDSMLRTPINNDVQQAPATVLEGMSFDQPKFDPIEGVRLSNRGYAENTPVPGQVRQTQVMSPSKGSQQRSGATAAGAGLQDSSLPVRAAAKAFTSVGQGSGGAIRAVGDFTGSDTLSKFGKNAAKAGQEFDQGMGQTGSVEGFGPKSPVPYLSDMAEGAVSSLAQSAAYASMFGAGAVIPLMSIQTAGQEYDKARTAGLDPAAALAGALPKGIFEAVGEKFTGLDKVAGAMGTILTKGASAEAKKTASEVLLKAGIREIPGEVITYLGQTGVDMLPGIGLNPDLTMPQFLDGLRDTVVQAGMMGGAMGGGGAAIRNDPRIKRLRDAGETGAADLLQSKLDQQNAAAAVEGELTGIAPLADFAKTPEFQADYRAMRTEGIKPVEAAGRSAITSGFRTLATESGMPEKAVNMAVEAAKKTELDKLPGFFQRFTQALANRGVIQAPEGTDTLGAGLETVRDHAMNAAMGVTLQADDVRGKMAAAEQLEQSQNPIPALDTPAPAATETIAAADAFDAGNDVRVTPETDAVHTAATSPLNDLPEPTQAQKEAGNYKVGRLRIAGMDIAVENPQGSVRRGTDASGNAWESPMRHHYGYFNGTTANDGDKLDVFVRPGTPEDYKGAVFVVDQIDPATGKLDEHKVLIGATTEEEARAMYQANYDANWQGLGAITRLPLPAFKAWAKSGALKEPLGELPTSQNQPAAQDQRAQAAIESVAPDVKDTPVRPRGQAETPAQAAADQTPAPEGSDAQGPAAAGADTGDAALEAPRVVLGRNNVPMSEGGKAFKTRLAADGARKLQPMMRVIRADGGYALTEKTPAQLAAQDKAARRLSNPQTSPAGQPIPAHAMIAAAGGLSGDERTDMGMEGNVTVGNRKLFAGAGKGLTIERATEKLIEDGYLPDDAGHDQARALIKRSLSQPQYTAEGFERMAEAETQARFDAAMTPEEAIDDAVAQIEALSDNQFDALDDADIPDFDAPSNTTLEAGMRDMGFTDQEIQDAIADQSRIPGSDSESRGGPVEGATGEAQADPGSREEAQEPAQEVTPAPADAGVSTSGPEFASKLRPDGTLAITGDAKAIRELLTAIPAKSLAGMKGGILVGRTQADKAAAILRGEKPKLTAREAAEAGQKAREAEKKAKAAAARAKPASEGLKVGIMPGNAEAVTVKDGIVYIGKTEALDFDNGEPVRVPDGSSDQQIAVALKDAGALSRRQRIFGLGKAEEGDGLTSPTPADVLAQQQRAADGAKAEAKAATESENKAKADAERGEFTLTGSNRVADVGAAGGQKGMFARGVWRSELADQITGSPMNASQPAGWKTYIDGLTKKGVKPDEIEWSGVREWLDMQTGKVTKAQVLDYLDGNGVQVTETVLGKNPVLDTIAKEMGFGGWSSYLTPEQEQAVIEKSKEYDHLGDNTKYGNYQLPGGENYRELLLTLPEKTPGPLTALPEGFEISIDSRPLYREQPFTVIPPGQQHGKPYSGWHATEAQARAAALERLNYERRQEGAKGYKSSHWDQPNILAHIRFNERTDADGKRVLFIEEIQSDWGQAAKKQGFRSVHEAELERLIAARDAQTDDAAAENIQDKIDSHVQRNLGVPDAPFVAKTDAWVALAIKRMVSYAAGNGFDRVAFVNGEQSAGRYDLSKQVDSVSWESTRTDGAAKNIELRLPNQNPIRLRVDSAGAVLAANGPGFSQFEGKQLDDIIGKDLAAKVMNEKDNGSLSGDGLKVGGEGMKAFYDKIVPAVAKDVLRKLGGGQIQTLRLPGTATYEELKAAGAATGLTQKELDAMPRAEHKALIDSKLGPHIGFDITPAMREKVAEGLPLFARQGFDADAFSRMFSSPSAMAVSDVQKAVDQLTSKWKSGPTIKVVATPADLPIDAPADARGLIHNGTAYIVARNHVNLDAVARTLAHEAIGHYGLWRMLGDEGTTRFNRNLQLALKSGNVPLGKIRDKVRAAYVDEKGKFNLTPAQEASEIAAFAVEDAIDVKTGEFKPGFGFVKGVWAKIAQFLRDIGIDIKFTNSELHGMLVSAMRGLKAGKRLDGGGQVMVAAARDGHADAATVLLQLGQREDLFQMPRSNATDLAEIAEAKGLTVAPVDRNSTDNKLWMLANTTPADAPGVESWIVTLPNGKHGTLTNAKGQVYINVSSVGEGNRGNAIYDLAANYAVNNGLQFIGDPNGVSPAAMRRRLENMLSSAVKYGTTNHLAPHPDQLEGNKAIGVPALKWTDGDTVGNMNAMVAASVAATDASNPVSTSNVHFDAATQSFRDGDHNRLDDASLSAMLGFDGRDTQAGSAGRATLQRNALYRALLQSEGARRAILDSVRGVGDSGSTGTGDGLKGTFYARGNTPAVDQTDTPAFKNWFGDSKVVDADGKPLVVYRGEHGETEDGDLQTALGTYTFAESPAVASSYASQPNDYRMGNIAKQPRVIAAHLSIKNPIIENRDDPFVELSDIAKKLSPAFAKHMALKHAGHIENTNNWEEIGASSVKSFLHFEPDGLSRLYMDAYPLLDDQEFVDFAKEQGFDGAIHIGNGESAREVEYRVFDKNQIKSAIGNNGDFDGGNPNIAFARGTANLFQPNIWSMPDATRTDRVIYELQDGKVDLKRAQEAIKASGQTITEEWDARLAETLYPGRVAYRSATFLDVEAKPLLEAMARNKVGMDELADYLHARGAEERNAQIAKVNPSLPDGGAGTNTKGELMTNQAARDYLANVPQMRKVVLDAMAARVDTITRGTRALLVAEGLEKQETIDAWEAVYQNYVPMFRDEAETAMPPHPQGAGFQVKGNASRRATGSTKEVTNILAHVLMQREAAITRAEKNRVALALYGQAMSHPNPDFWTTIRPSMKPAEIAAELVAMGVDPMTAQVGMEGIPTIRSINPLMGKVQDMPNPIYRNLPGAIPLKLNGSDRVLMINTKSERGMRLATSLKNLDGLTQLDIAGNIIGKSTRWLAAVNTQYNPAFGLVNLTRDTLGGAINLGSTELRGKALEVLAKTPAAILGIARELASGGQTGKWQSLYRQFQADGGQTGFKENFRDPNDRAKAVERELAAIGRTKLSPGRAGHFILDLLDGFNTTLENAVRLSAYSAALDNGISRAEAARLGRELTVDFNRKGRAGREVGPLYAFFNASVQGVSRTMETLRGPTGAKVIAGGIGLGILQALMLAAAGYDDDEIPEFVKTRALIIPLFGREKNYIAIPYPLGLHVLPNTGRVLAELTLNGGKDIAKRSVAAIGEIAGAFNPLGGGNVFTADGALKTVAPTVIDPLIEIGFNRNFAGGTIEKMGYGGEADNRPGVARAKESTQRSTTGQAYMAISAAINKAMGGTDYEAGLASPTPERVRYLAQTVGGGVLREFEKTVNASTAAARGEKVKMSQIPVAGRFYGEVDDDQAQTSRFYENSRKLRKIDSSVKAARKAGDDEAADKIEDRNPEAALIRSFNRTQRALAALNKEAVQIVGDVQEMAVVDKERAQLMREFNTDLEELERESGKVTLADRLRTATRPKLAEMKP